MIKQVFIGYHEEEVVEDGVTTIVKTPVYEEQEVEDALDLTEEQPVEDLQSQIDELKEQNEMLLECLLEISEMLYA